MSATTELPVKHAPDQPIRCLVIQLARLGDTIQSLMALRAAKQLYPHLEIHFVAREKFSAAAKRVPWIKEVITLPSDTLLGPVLKGQKSEQQALRDVARWMAPLAERRWDFILNWSYSEASSYLTALLPARVKLGFSRRTDGTLFATDGWSHYVQAILQGEVKQNIHLTDILTTQLLTALQIHAGEPADAGHSAVTSKTFFALKLNETDYGLSMSDYSKKWVGIQLGAGSVAKTWEPENWARLATRMLTEHPECNIVLLGGLEDAARSKRFMTEVHAAGLAHKELRRIVSLVGQTDFDLWAYAVSRCQWIMAGDTAVIHLASVLGTRVLNVSVGPVRWTETGPYGNGHYVITAASQRPEDVTPDAVYETWSHADRDFEPQRRIHWIAHSDRKTAVFRSRIRAVDDGGGVVYDPLIERSMGLDDWGSMVMGHIARAWYCGWVPPVGQELSRSVIHPGLIQQLRRVGEASGVLLKVCEEARQTATLLGGKSSKLRSAKIMKIKDREELHQLGKKLIELDQLLERLAVTEPLLKAFPQMTKVLMHNLQGTHLSDLSKESAACYRQLMEGATILTQWVTHTLELAKPRAVKGPSVVQMRGVE